ncbi:unnamed protein product, partial [Didymodactylos carnosus]
EDEDDTFIYKDKNQNSSSHATSSVTLDQKDYLNVHVKPVVNEERKLNDHE